MSSRGDQICDAKVAALGAASVTTTTGATITKPAGLNVHRHRTIPLAQDQLPAQVVYMLAEEVKTGPARGLDNKRLARRYRQICVESRVNAGSTTPDQALDPLISWAVQTICADQSTGGLTHDVQELGTTWDQAEEDSVLASAKTVFLVEFITSASDPDAATAGWPGS